MLVTSNNLMPPSTTLTGRDIDQPIALSGNLVMFWLKNVDAFDPEVVLFLYSQLFYCCFETFFPGRIPAISRQKLGPITKLTYHFSQDQIDHKHLTAFVVELLTPVIDRNGQNLPSMDTLTNYHDPAVTTITISLAVVSSLKCKYQYLT